MKTLNFAKRTAKEILRDPLTLIFGLGFSGILIIILSLIQKNIPVSLFEPNRLVPAMTVFGLSFLTLFSSTVVAKDRESAFLERLYTTPMRSYDFILGYTLPFLPIALLQAVFCYLVGLLFGLEIGVGAIYSLLFIVPISVFFISLGLFFGSLLTQKQVGGICGALLTNLTAWLSGIWFDLELVGGFFEKIATVLPFYHAVRLMQGSFNLNFEGLLPSVMVVLAYSLIFLLIAIFTFLKKMKR